MSDREMQEMQFWHSVLLKDLERQGDIGMAIESANKALAAWRAARG